jgi:uncharacterized protein YeeX (DUF496 family)
MTDKFVVSTNEIGEIIVTDVETDRVYRYDAPSNFFGLIRLLNEQQATIKSKDKQLERLYNYFQDYLKDEMSGNAFSEMWDFVKEDEEWEDE